MPCDVSIIIPVLNRLEFTRLCLDRIRRNTGDDVSYEVIVVDNGSTDGTASWFAAPENLSTLVRYQRNESNLGFAKANNIGARLSTGRNLLFLNNDTLVQPGWLSAMLDVRKNDPRVGVVGIKQLFPYTNTIYHTGMVFTPDGRPVHLYPHLDASLEKVNQQREYQAVMGACLLIDRPLFEACGGFDEKYLNGYEDVDLCLQARQRGHKVVCCTSAFIYHYGQISEGRTSADDRNASYFASKWAGIVKADRDDYAIRDRGLDTRRTPTAPATRRLPDDCIYLADALDDGSALTWINAELALALHARGALVMVNGQSALSPTLSPAARRQLSSLATAQPIFGGIQVKWSHYRPRHLNLDLSGSVNLEFFVINYLFNTTRAEPWDFWLQCLRQNQYDKLALSEFCDEVLEQLRVDRDHRHVWYPGYSREIAQVEPPRRSSRFRFLTVTNSHDLQRYNTTAILDAYDRVFSVNDEVLLTIKDYGASSGDTTIRRALDVRSGGPAIEYIDRFSEKHQLIELYKSSDAFVSAHRGEGFGMKILDAMACGVPVITPLFGGPTAYCATDNCFPVAFSLVPMGDCLDTRSLHITNGPTWAEVDPGNLGQQMRRVYDDPTSARNIGRRGHDGVVTQFSWESAADRFLAITSALRARQGATGSRAVTNPRVESGGVGMSPYWLGLRVSVVIPTHNRKDKLRACLEALSKQSILPHEFEVLIVDDGSTDGTGEFVHAMDHSFDLRYFRQDAAGPGAARNLGIEKAAGELVLFLGDDIIADERLLEEHLLAHAVRADRGTAILGHIDWPPGMTPNAVMDYVCGDAMLQFAYTYIPTAVALDHRFFYTSNISLKREFLVDAADAGVRFDPSFRYAAFEDSEYAFRLLPRGLHVHYAAGARVFHDHWMDLESFSRREFNAGAMAVVFYRKHPGQDDQLNVRWVADIVTPAAALLRQPEFLAHLAAFDHQIDDLLRSMAGSLEGLIALDRQAGSAASSSLATERLRAALHNVFSIIFDVERTRGKVQEWFSMVEDPEKMRAARTLAVVMRKIEFLNRHADALGPVPGSLPVDRAAISNLSGRLSDMPGLDAAAATALTRTGARTGRGFRKLLMNPYIFSRMLKADRYIEARLQSSNRPTWLENYRRMRRRVRNLV